MNFETSQSTKDGYKTEEDIHNLLLEHGMKSNLLSPATTDAKRAVLRDFYNEVLHCNVKFVTGRNRRFMISAPLSNQTHEVISDLLRLYELEQLEPNVEYEQEQLRASLGGGNPKEIRVQGIDVYAEDDDNVCIVESKTEVPNSSTVRCLKRDSLIWQAILLNKNRIENRDRKVNIIVASLGIKSYKKMFEPSQLSRPSEICNFFKFLSKKENKCLYISSSHTPQGDKATLSAI